MNNKVKVKTLNFIKNHPLMGYKKFMADSGIKVSDCYYYMLRKQIKKGVNIPAPSSSKKTNALDFIKNHSPMSYDKFTSISGLKISDCYYYMLRSEIFSRGNRINKKSRAYINLITIPSKGLSSEAKKAIATVLRALNTQGMHLEILENFQDRTLEIRRIMT